MPSNIVLCGGGNLKSYHAFSFNQSILLCKNMSNESHKFVAIGVTHSSDTLNLICEILADPKFGFGAEGTMASGYEMTVIQAMVNEAVTAIRKHPKIHIEGHEVRFYERPRFLDDGTRYDRVIDHYLGEDPNRPSVNGISLKL